jgi:hypothetical protein
MQVKNLFILNETYPLPLDKYEEFKSRKDGCKANPMCTNKLKYDAESFIVDFGKKHGVKIEIPGEESNFIFLKDDEVPGKVIAQKITEVKQSSNLPIIFLGVVLALGAYAIIKKDFTVGAFAVLASIILMSINPTKK